LVATTVVEVGVDVPNATVMVIEHAERFGLSQLHQLRGRIGRGAERSHCILVAPGHMSDNARARLETMVRTSNGFEITETDLQLRSRGQFLGPSPFGPRVFPHCKAVRRPRPPRLGPKKIFSLCRGPKIKKQTKPIPPRPPPALPPPLPFGAHWVRT